MKPLTLVILDGWGLSPVLRGNAIFNTPTPNFDKLLSIFPSTTLHASGEEVGLPWGEMGNSEVGHLNLGTGRVVMQDLPRIDKSINDKSFFSNPSLLEAIKYAKDHKSNLHLVGLFSAGGVHSHLNHLLALLDLCKKEEFNRVYIHLIADGRDTPARRIIDDLPKLNEKIKETNVGTIASIAGRYYAMDRDNRMDRTEKAFRALHDKKCPNASSVETVVKISYNQNKSDEFIEPVAIKNTAKITSDDAVIFWNFRSDRARQLSDKIISIDKVFFVSFTSYNNESRPNVKVAFFADKIIHQLAQILSERDLSQLHIAETEKYAHVTYFFNGGSEEKFDGEERILIQSPKVATYDLKPKMSAEEITEKFIDYFTRKKPAFTVLNYANADMVGHTGVYKAVQIAISEVDKNLGKLAECVLNNGGDLLITADHGNAEQMINPETGEVDKEHTTNPVPFVVAFAEKARIKQFNTGLESKIAFSSGQPTGILADVTATIIKRLNLKQPAIISGQDLEDLI